MEELLRYLEQNHFSYSVAKNGVITIGEDTYEFSEPNQEGLYFNRGFHYIGSVITANNYIYKFGPYFFTLKKGDEKDVKLKLLKYIGKANFECPTISFLGVHGPFDLLNGSGSYKDWVQKAKFLGVEKLGICEKNTLAGVLKFQLECQKQGIGCVIGETVTVFNPHRDIKYDIKLYVKNEKGWLNLLSINKIVNSTGGGRILEDRLEEFLEGLVAVVDPKSLYFNNLPSFLEGAYYQLDSVEFERSDRNELYYRNLQDFILSEKLKPVSICDAYYIDQEFHFLKKLLNRVKGEGGDLSENQYFKSKEEYLIEMSLHFKGVDVEFARNLIEEAVENEDGIGRECNYTIEIGHRHLPKYEMTEEEKKKYENNEDMFLSLIADGLDKLNLSEEEMEVYMDRIATEVDVIKYGDVLDYFLVLWDIMQFCKREGILTGIGRGSAGGSLVAYLMGITHINPLNYNLLFERFLSKARVTSSLPDIDSDIDMSRRPEVKKYMEERYGEDQVCSVGTYTTLQIKAALKDFGKVLGVPASDIAILTNSLGMDARSLEDLMKAGCQRRDIGKFIEKYPELVMIAGLVNGQPKAKSIHACAMMIYPKEKDMFHWSPIRQQDNMYISEWEGGELDSAGFLKEDILGILQLTKFSDILKLIKEHRGEEVDIYNVPLNDRTVFKYFQKGWNGDVFHFGAKGLTGYCKLLKPDNIDELINCIGLFRPGVMESGFHNKYVARKFGQEDVEIRIGEEDVLKRTRGIMIWQEQTMQLFSKLGGFDMVTADTCRRAIGKKQLEKIVPFKKDFKENYEKEYGVDEKYAEETWQEIENMASYSFNKSHAAAYATTGYTCQWLKVHYPLEYWAVAFSYADDEDYPLYLHEINESGEVKMLPPDINNSGMTIVADKRDNGLLWSLASIKQVGEKAQQQIMEDREKFGQYFSLSDFLERLVVKGSAVNKSVVENLILSGAFDSIENITEPKDRLRLIDQYRIDKGVKVDRAKDIFHLNETKTSYNWWYLLRQKRLCGFAFFDYKELYENYFKEQLDNPYFNYVEVEDIDEEDCMNHEKVIVGGYVYSKEIKSGKKGEYCILVLEQNYRFITVMFWSEEYESFEHILGECDKQILFMNGVENWDERNSMPVIYATEATEVLVLT